jgi:hypothetical protein
MSERFPRLRLAVFLFDVAVVWLVCRFSMLQRYYNLDYSFHKYHFSVVFNPIFELANGHTPGVDFSPQYGLYGYFFYFLQKLVWGDIHSRDTVTLMGVLVFLGNIALYMFLVKMFRNKFVAAMTVAAIVYFSQTYLFLFFEAPYYAYLPIRTIIPMFTLSLVGFVHTAQGQRVRPALSVCAALIAVGGIYWNPESGFAAVLTLVGYMVYRAWYTHGLTDKQFWKETALTLALVVLCFLVWFSLLQFITANRSGAWYPLASLFLGNTIFAKDGLLLYPLPEKHPYVYVLWVYSAVIILALSSLFVHKNKPNEEAYNNALGFATGLMGFGLFIYYLGRTQSNHFTMTIWPAFITLAFIAMKLSDYFKLKISECRKNCWSWRNDAANLVSGGIAGIISLFFAFFLFVTSFFLPFIFGMGEMQAYSAARNSHVTAPTDYSIETVDRYRLEHLFMVNEYSMYYLNELGLKNDYLGPSVPECFFAQDYLNIIAQLERYEGRVFVAAYLLPSNADSFTYKGWGAALHGAAAFSDGETFSEKLQRVFAERYVLVAEEGGWTVYDSK